MSIDLNKLTPAPWEMDRISLIVCVYTAVHGPDGKQLFDTCNSEQMEIEDNSDEDGPHYNDRIGEANLGFAALARNALDAMQRRGWGVIKFDDGWCPGYPMKMPPELALKRWPDPFTALVEADAWYKANVEGKP